MLVGIMLEGRFLVVWLCFTPACLGTALNGTQDHETAGTNTDSCKFGYRTMKLKRAETEEPKCQFPLWAQEMGKLHSFSFSSMYQFVEEGYVLSLSNYSTASKRSHELSRTICIEVQEEDHNYIKMVTRVIANCDQMYKCLRILKRTENIIEIQEGSPTNYEKAACTLQNFDDKLMIYTTLFKENLEKQPCPVNGIHNVTDLDLDGQSETCEKNGFTNINIKCGDTHVIQFYKECPNEKRLNKLEITSSSVYHCLGGWEEQIPLREMPNPYARNGASFLANYYTGRGGHEGRRTNLFVSDNEGPDDDLQNQQYYEANVTIGYVVAMRQRPPLSDEEEEVSEGHSGSEHPKRICFIYAVVNGSGVGSSYSWTVDKTACLRNIRPGHMARQRFNTTVLGICGSGRPQEQGRWLLLVVLWYSCNL